MLLSLHSSRSCLWGVWPWITMTNDCFVLAKMNSSVYLCPCVWWAGGKWRHSHAFGPVGEKTNGTDTAAAAAASAAILSQWTLCNHSQHRCVVLFFCRCFVSPFCLCGSHNVKHYIFVCKSVLCVFSAHLEGEFEEMESRLVYLETLCSHCDEQAFKQHNISSLETYRKKKRCDLLFSGDTVNTLLKCSLLPHESQSDQGSQCQHKSRAYAERVLLKKWNEHLLIIYLLQEGVGSVRW